MSPRSKPRKPPKAANKSGPQPESPPAAPAPPTAPLTPRERWVPYVLMLALTLGAYSNHFDNAFHFDDWHTVQQNPHIQSLATPWRFFTDPTTLSTLPSHHGFRPLMTLSFAVDYAIAGKLSPRAFHVQSFLWHALLACLVLGLFQRLLANERLENANWSARATRLTAFFGATLFAVHPAGAETVNYICQRPDIMAAVGCVASLLLYMRQPRAVGWHLLPFLVASFAKASAIMYGPILITYVFLYTKKDRLATALKHGAPAMALALAFYALHQKMTPATSEPGGGNKWTYWGTQPFALLHELRIFLLPNALTADTDMARVEHWTAPELWLGLGFLAVCAAVLVLGIRARKWAPLAFAVSWFLLFNVPTSVTPLAEVSNDHRMFGPFIGLSFAVVSSAALWLSQRRDTRLQPAAVALASLLILACSGGLYLRNRVWLTEETLWKDVTEKSPKNGRGMMNYGLTQMSKGEYKAALDWFERAYVLLPNYVYLETNLGVVNGALGNNQRAEKHFKRGMTLSREPITQLYYARFLDRLGRTEEAKAVLKDGLRRHSAQVDLRLALLALLEKRQDYSELRAWLKETRELFPYKKELNRYAAALGNAEKRAQDLEANEAGAQPSELCALAELRYRLGNNDKALVTAAKLVQAQAPCGYRVSAMAQAQLGNWTEAQRLGQLGLDKAGQSGEERLALEAIIKESKARSAGSTPQPR